MYNLHPMSRKPSANNSALISVFYLVIIHNLTVKHTVAITSTPIHVMSLVEWMRSSQQTWKAAHVSSGWSEGISLMLKGDAGRIHNYAQGKRSVYRALHLRLSSRKLSQIFIGIFKILMQPLTAYNFKNHTELYPWFMYYSKLFLQPRGHEPQSLFLVHFESPWYIKH